MQTPTKTPWSDVIIDEGDEKILSYRTAMVVYEESLTNCRYVARGWNGAGFVNFYDGRINTSGAAIPQAFRLEIDGQFLDADWQWVGCERRDGDQPIPAMPRPFQIHTIVTLTHGVRPVTVKVHTGLDGTSVITRWLEVTNDGDRPAALSTAASWSGVLQQTKYWRAKIADGSALYSLGYFGAGGSLYSLGNLGGNGWGFEGDFQWVDLPNAGYAVDGRFRRGRHRHPFFVLRNNATGEHFTGQFAWSGGYRFEFDLNEGVGDSQADLTFAASTDAPAPQRVLAPGETVVTPEMHLGLTYGGLDEAVNAMHAHIRRSVIMEQPRGRGCWVESGIGPEIEITVDQVNHAIETAADFGAEVFFIDASWYAKPYSEWWTTVGDWDVNRERFPEGIKPFRDKVHSLGMLWGLWMDAERVGTQSMVARNHPDWLATGSGDMGGLLDLTNAAAASWMEDQIGRVIEENELEFFRLDYNTDSLSRAKSRRGEYVESSFWRYYEAQYAIYDRLRAQFPNVIFENCAGGGGRTDLGIVRRFSHAWVTDWQIAPRSFAITNGMTMALPPEYVDRLLGGQSGHTAAEFEFQLRLLLFVRPTIAWTHPLRSQWNPQMLAAIRHAVDLYKGFIRPFLPESRIFHHTPAVQTYEPQGWGILELASADGSRGMCGLFQLSAPTTPEYTLRLRGLDIGRRYRVTFDNSGGTCDMDGVTLMLQGLTVRLEGALTSELILFEAL